MSSLHYQILAAAVATFLGVIGKIVFDWLKARRENGHFEEMSFNIKEMSERQKKMWEAIERLEGRITK